MKRILLAAALLVPSLAFARDPGEGCPPDSPDAAGTLAADVDAASHAAGASPSTAATAACAKTAADVTNLGAAIDGATRRLDLKVGSVPNRAMQKQLIAAAKRGVEVHVYLVTKKPGSGADVLATEGLEASGVDVTVDVADQLGGIVLVVDESATNVTADCALDPVSGAGADAAEEAFDRAIREPDAATPAKLAKESVRLLGMPDASGAELLGLVNAATTSIDLEIYQLQSPAMVAALKSAAARGVKVRVMLEPRTVGAVNYPMVAKQLGDAGIEVKATPPAFDTHHNVDHAKFMVVDGKEMTFGTGNMVRSGLGGNPAREFDNRDFWLRDNRKQSVAEANALFDADWNRKTTSAASFKNLVVTPDNADEKIVGLINGASHRVLVWNQSLNEPGVVDALLAAKQRGADVHVLLGYQPGFGGAAPANQPAIDKLTAAGITAGYYTRNYLHAKGVVADGTSYLGSQNFTKGGLINNREVGEIVDDTSVADALTRQFGDDEAHSKPSR